MSQNPEPETLRASTKERKAGSICCRDRKRERREQREERDKHTSVLQPSEQSTEYMEPLNMIQTRVDDIAYTFYMRD